MALRTLFRDVLRLLTVEEVEELTTITEVEDMYSLTELVKEYLCSAYTPPLVQKVSSLTAPREALAANAEESTAQSGSGEAGEKISRKTIAEFIFQEKEKFKKFNQQSKKQKSLEVYRHTLAHGRSAARQTNDAETPSTVGTGKGTLINRRVG